MTNNNHVDRRQFYIEKSISVGNILTIVVIIGMLFSIFYKLSAIEVKVDLMWDAYQLQVLRSNESNPRTPR